MIEQHVAVLAIELPLGFRVAFAAVCLNRAGVSNSTTLPPLRRWNLLPNFNISRGSAVRTRQFGNIYEIDNIQPILLNYAGYVCTQIGTHGMTCVGCFALE